MDTGTNITRFDVRAPRTGQRRSTLLGLRPAVLPQSLFAAELLARGLPQVAQSAFQGEVTSDALAALGSELLVRADPEFNEVEALVRLRAGELALIDAGHGHVNVEVAADSREHAVSAMARVRASFETAPPAEDRVSMAFWMRGEYGGQVRHRDVDAAAFEQIEANYTAPVRAALARLIAAREPDRGRLILWRGEPGTGKSHALLALARAWAPWCSTHFVTDPEELLGAAGAYMLDVLSWEGDDDDRWRLLILEDASELIAADARALAGQALSRLLNIADGVLGQGTRTLLLITTNEPVRRLHPAIRRPGRCLADIEFTPLSVAEANAWLAARGRSDTVEQPTTLAVLFGRVEENQVQTDAPERAFGFARALEK